VTQASAGRGVHGVRALIAEIGRLRGDPDALEAMRSAAARMSQPGTAADIADVIASQVVRRVAATTVRWGRSGGTTERAIRHGWEGA
jgi:hypothetical protein